MRSTPGYTTRRRHKKILKQAKGYMWGRKKVYSLAKRAVMKAGLHAYESRRLKKRDMRSLWIARLSAALRPLSMKYSEFIYRLTRKRVTLDRKILSNLAIEQPEVFQKIVDFAKK